MCLFVHARGTTGAHARERAKHVYAERCAQCGTALTETTRVAAHLRVRPCGLPCCGFTTLRTACKACNHRCSRAPRSFWGWKRRLVRLRGAEPARLATARARH